jgi:sugar O-acyltransferase (sialic acid O-acetyltransferase NeuD family)
MKKLILFGLGDFADIAHFYFTHDTSYEVVAFCADGLYIQESTKLGLPVIAFEEVDKVYSPTDYAMFVAIGYSKLNEVRKQKYFAIKEKGYDLVSYISSKATVWARNNIGEHCFILENQVIQPFAKIGSNVVLWSGNHIGHHSQIGDHCFITSHVVIAGNVKVEEQCFIGINATVRDGITVGTKSVIGAGALVMCNVEAESIYKPVSTQKYNLGSSQINL